jgi:hypothetical protein
MDVFDMYSEWIYHGHILLQEDTDCEDRITDIDTLINAYILGLQLRDTPFRNAILQTLFEVFSEMKSYPIEFAIAKVYKNIRGTSRIRRFLVDVYANKARSHWFEGEDAETYPKEFLKDWTVKLLNMHPTSTQTDFIELRQEYCGEGEDDDEVFTEGEQSEDEGRV